MNPIKKLIAGSPYRITRAHTEKGTVAFRGPEDCFDCLRSLGTFCVRIATGEPPNLPWLTYPAIRFLQAKLKSDARIFEFGGGMSTVWLERRCSEIHTVEDNSVWFERLSMKTRRTKLTLADGEAYINAIDRFEDGFFDMIVVDGSIDRMACFQRAERHLKPGGLMVIDDTDKEQVARGQIACLDELMSATRAYRVHRFSGWVPGSFWAKETTIATKL